jgi:hypothetical protein
MTLIVVTRGVCHFRPAWQSRPFDDRVAQSDDARDLLRRGAYLIDEATLKGPLGQAETACQIRNSAIPFRGRELFAGASDDEIVVLSRRNAGDCTTTR